MSRFITATGLASLFVGAVLLLASFAPSIAAPAVVFSVPPTPVASFVAPSASTTANATAQPSPTALPPIPPGYRIQVPALSIDLAILEGDIQRDSVLARTPDNFAFHLPGTAIPGTGANSYLYAHARRGMFLSLWNAKIGDIVWISTPDGRALRYVVSEIHPRVAPDDVSMTEASGPDRLTLQTSTGPNQSDPRFVVVALPG